MDLFELIDKIDKNILISISGVLLGLLFPLAIFLVEDVKNEDFRFDRTIIFTQVIQPLKMSLSIIFLTFSLVFPLRYSIYIYGIGFYLYINTIIRFMKWVNIKGIPNEELNSPSSYKNILRINYLNGLKTFDESFSVWSYLWQHPDNRKDLNEEMLVKNFVKFYERNYFESRIYGLPPEKWAGSVRNRANKERLDTIIDEIIDDEKCLRILYQYVWDEIIDGNTLKREKEALIFIYGKCIAKINSIKIEETNDSFRRFIYLNMSLLIKTISDFNDDDKYYFIGKFKEDLEQINFEKALADYCAQFNVISPIDFYNKIYKHLRYKSNEEIIQEGKDSFMSQRITDLLAKYPVEL